MTDQWRESLREAVQELRDKAHERFLKNKEHFKTWPLAQVKAYEEVLKLLAALASGTPTPSQPSVSVAQHLFTLSRKVAADYTKHSGSDETCELDGEECLADFLYRALVAASGTPKATDAAHPAPPSINPNQTRAEQFHKDVEYIHACHIEGALRTACRDVFERREKEAFAAGTAASPRGERLRAALEKLRDRWRVDYPLSVDMDHSYAINANAVWNCANEIGYLLDIEAERAGDARADGGETPEKS